MTVGEELHVNSIDPALLQLPSQDQLLDFALHGLPVFPQPQPSISAVASASTSCPAIEGPFFHGRASEGTQDVVPAIIPKLADVASHGDGKSTSHRIDRQNRSSQPVPKARPEATSIHTPHVNLRKRTKATKRNRKSRRHLISTQVKTFLDAQFDLNPYPSAAETSEWARQHGLPQSTIKNWFSNARSRKSPDKHQSLVEATQCRLDLETQLFSNMKTLAPPSPTPSNISLERYLAASPQEEAASAEAIQANIDAALHEHAAISIQERDAGSCSRPPVNLPTVTLNGPLTPLGISDSGSSKGVLANWSAPPSTLDLEDPFAISREIALASIADYDKYTSLAKQGNEFVTSNYAWDNGSSAGSMSSAHSYGSIGSHYSLDSRGSRRGRRRWNKPFMAPFSLEEDNPSPLLNAQQDPNLFSEVMNFGQFNMEGPRTYFSPVTSPQISPQLRPEVRMPLDQQFPPLTLDSGPQQNPGNVPTLFQCTFPGCDSTFTSQYEWSRHEESIHYPQKVWVCCKVINPEDIPGASPVGNNINNSVDVASVWKQLFDTYNFFRCATRPESERTFYRKDQLVQHIKTCHINPAEMSKKEESELLSVMVRKTLPALWEKEAIYNSSKESGHYCSACSRDLKSWTMRKSHFATHFKEGIFTWTRPDIAKEYGALFIGPSFYFPTLSQPFKECSYICPTCDTFFFTYTEALIYHKQCRGWRCQYLKDPSAVFMSIPYEFGHFSWCKLCDGFSEFSGPGSIMTEKKKEHVEMHGLQCCHKTVKPDFQSFCAHLKTHVGVAADRTWREADLQAWMCGVKSSLCS